VEVGSGNDWKWEVGMRNAEKKEGEKVGKREGGKERRWEEVGSGNESIADCGFEGQRILIKDFRMRIFGYKSE
jgi:hypothetical protein